MPSIADLEKELACYTDVVLHWQIMGSPHPSAPMMSAKQAAERCKELNDLIDTERRILGIEEWMDRRHSDKIYAEHMLSRDPSWSIVIAGIDADLAECALQIIELRKLIDQISSPK